MKIREVLKEFKEFALRGSVIDLAVGIIIGGAFNNLVKSLVSDVITPPIGFLFGSDFSNLFWTIGPGHYDTLADAQQAGVATLNYGVFINNLISFLIMAVAVFFLVKIINTLRRRLDSGKEPTATTKPCPYCVSTIPIGATRCPNCTSELPKAA